MQFTFWDGVVLFGVLGLLMGLLNVIANIRFNRFAMREAARVDVTPLVSVLVPARNEALNIEAAGVLPRAGIAHCNRLRIPNPSPTSCAIQTGDYRLGISCSVNCLS